MLQASYSGNSLCFTGFILRLPRARSGNFLFVGLDLSCHYRGIAVRHTHEHERSASGCRSRALLLPATTQLNCSPWSSSLLEVSGCAEAGNEMVKEMALEVASENNDEPGSLVDTWVTLSQRVRPSLFSNSAPSLCSRSVAHLYFKKKQRKENQTAKKTA
jgi:hypothetical protein